jgi:hypothetical protein
MNADTIVSKVWNFSTTLRLSTGVFFDNRPAQSQPWTKDL